MRSGPQGWRAGAETIAGREGAGVGGWGPPVITTALLTHARNSHQRSHAVPYTLPLLPPSGAELPSAPILGTHLGLTVVPTDTESSRFCSVKVPAWDCTLLVPPVLRWETWEDHAPVSHLGHEVSPSERSPGEGNTTHSSILAWRICGQRSLVGYSLWDHKESDITEGLSARTYQVLTRMQCKSTLTVLWKTKGKQ